MIHKFKFENSNIVMDIHSGSIHLLDDVAYTLVEEAETLSKEELMLKYAGQFEKEQIEEAYEELMSLKEQQMLYTPDLYEEFVPAFLEREPVVKALCLHVAHDCNLACQYCFAGEGEYHGERGMMSFEVGKNAIDFIIQNSKHRKNIEIDFFGGEPLMNFEVVKQIVEYARSREAESGKTFRFTMTTNGVLLNDEIIDYLNANMYNVVLSLDGRPEVNDRMRPTCNGKGSYEVILPKFKKLVEKRQGKQYYVRGTFTRHNLDFAEDVKHIHEAGFDEVSVEPVVAPTTMNYALQQEDVSQLCKEYETLAKHMVKLTKQGKGFNFFHFMIDLEGGPCVHKRLAGCGSGTEYLAVTPDGDLYPCHQFVGLPEFKMGDVKQGITNLEKRAEFEKCNVYSKEMCKSCWAKFQCSGGCAANSYNFHGTINSVYEIGCALQKKRIECAVGIKAELLESE
ncbi:thioether cross-link-forming SCIFF peptide maturase [Sporanaerobium hydrogeniformans]|uniref:Thioether cross-link-forming SCIFF peptide maturase n=1 Tax=Sporanaerobium hydrogeniformans TaxID=3072179 RepID=A0AC61DEN4_9FIRM|nr:thioether cross-link-forming SCIFF peptide maturase [Sporanaerobium hydrogeniformans]PHV71641.1 thioether cross-link-forming SCIFF peptide maturase [Sporanaerobium hydrogeniformans]